MIQFSFGEVAMPPFIGEIPGTYGEIPGNVIAEIPGSGIGEVSTPGHK